MDIRCTKCGEPWELDTLHELVGERHPELKYASNASPSAMALYRQNYDKAFAEARRDFTRRGCEAFEEWGGHHNYPADRKAAELSSIAFELMGDDIDGVASMMDDAEAMGLL